MAENVLFDPTKNTKPVGPPISRLPAAQIGRSAKSWFPADVAPPPPPPSGSSLGLLFKIGLALIFLLVGLGAGAYFLLPYFSQSSSNKVTLKYWGLWEDKKIMQPLLDEFHKQNPNITVDYEEQDIKQLAKDNQNYPKRVIARINAGEGPDLFRYHNTWYPLLSSVLAPLTSNVTTPKDFSATYFPVVSTDLLQHGAIYGIPLGFDDLALFVNPDIFKSGGEQVPNDWFDFESRAAKLTVKGSDGTITTSGAALGTLGPNLTHGADIMALLLADSDVDPTKIANNATNAQNALLYFTRFTATTNATWNENLPPSIEMFAKGNLAMYIGYSWDIFTIQHLNPNLQFSIYPMPSLTRTDKTKVRHTIASYWVEGVSLRSQHQKEAMLLMKFLNQKDTQQQFYANASKERGFGEPFARQDLGDTLKNNPLLAPFEQQGPDAVSSIFVADTFDGSLNEYSIQYLHNAVTQVATTGSAADAVTTLASGITQVLAPYGR